MISDVQHMRMMVPNGSEASAVQYSQRFWVPVPLEVEFPARLPHVDGGSIILFVCTTTSISCCITGSHRNQCFLPKTVQNVPELHRTSATFPMHYGDETGFE